GTWLCQREYKDHTFTPCIQSILPAAMREGFQSWTARYGAAISHLEMRFVNHWSYVQIVIAGVPERAAAKSSGPPPAPVLRVLVRINPEMRRRAKAAKRALSLSLWQEDRRRWLDRDRPARIAANLALQDEALDSLDDAVLADHVRRAAGNALDGA